MVDDKVAEAARRARLRSNAVTASVARVRQRLAPRMIVADVAKVVMARSAMKIRSLDTTPKQRKLAILTGSVAAATALVMHLTSRDRFAKTKTGYRRNADPALNDRDDQ